MRTIFFACLFLSIFCQYQYFYHYANANVSYNREHPVKVFGPVMQDAKYGNGTYTFAGIHVSGNVKTPYALVCYYERMGRALGKKYEPKGGCSELKWGTKSYGVECDAKLNGTWYELDFSAVCKNKTSKIHWEIKILRGRCTGCLQYTPAEAATHAKLLVGEKGDIYQPVHVLNQAVMGYAYYEKIKNCDYYLKNFDDSKEAKPGFLIVGTDGAHCGIITQEGDKFIHANPITKTVIETPLTMAKAFFRNGYILKDYTICNAP